MDSDDDHTGAFDSLPYYDNDLELYPNLREKVDKELARECKPGPTLHPLVPAALELFKNHPLLAAEMARVEAHEPFPALDSVRYQLPAPTTTGEEAWRDAVGNAHAQLEHQRLRQTNLALLQTYGGNAWRIQNYMLEAAVGRGERAVEAMKEATTLLNRERKEAQSEYGLQLTALERRWTELLSDVLQMSVASST